MSEPCRACGAERGTFICRFCGTPVRTGLNEAEEREALDELHAALSKGETGAFVLKNAFIPNTPAVLIEAGLRMLPVLEGAVAENGAAGRLLAICVKLGLLRSDPTCAAAEAEFRTALARYTEYDNRFGRYMVVGVIVLLVIVVGGPAYFLLR